MIAGAPDRCSRNASFSQVQWRVVRSEARALGAGRPDVDPPAARGACAQRRNGGGGRRAVMAARISWNRTIQAPDRSADAARLASLVGHNASKRPSRLVEATAGSRPSQSVAARIAGSRARRPASLFVRADHASPHPSGTSGTIPRFAVSEPGCECLGKRVFARLCQSQNRRLMSSACFISEVGKTFISEKYFSMPIL